MKSRNHLPFRRNTEGYFLDKNKNILAQVSKEGYLLFPGGGIEEQETPEQGLIRETFEETGAVVEQPLKVLGKLNIIWEEDWAKTDKQKKRYEEYQGDEMYFFFGRIKEFRQQAKQEDSWREEKLMQLDKAINILEKIPDKNSYRKKQLQYLKEIESKQNDQKLLLEVAKKIAAKVKNTIANKIIPLIAEMKKLGVNAFFIRKR